MKQNDWLQQFKLNLYQFKIQNSLKVRQAQYSLDKRNETILYRSPITLNHLKIMH